MSEQQHFLVVDDDDVDVETVRRAFKRANADAELVIARDGLEALEVLRSPETLHPMTILLDLNMPRMNGLELLDEIRKDPDLHWHQVFILTTSEDDSDLFAAYSRHVAGYIVKPVTFEKVCEAISVLGNLYDLNHFPPRLTEKSR